MVFSRYTPQTFFDELFNADGTPRPHAAPLIDRMSELQQGEIERRQKAAELALLNMGITFTLNKDEGTERIFPLDIIPRIIDASEWKMIDRGLKQRIQALNHFLNDIYHDQHVVKDKIIPIETIQSGDNFLEQCRGLVPPKNIWPHITGTDLVRDENGTYNVLEDNLRCPSGVSYVLENRTIMKKTFPMVFAQSRVQPVDDYATKLMEALQNISPQKNSDPTVVILTPGIYNSAYFEHAFLSQQMGIDLVEGNDLVIKDGYVCMRTTHGFQRIDVIYRRIDDIFLDPTVFRKDSFLGVPGLMDVYRAGRVAIANAPGTGIADDKLVYSYVPDFIRYYLKEDPILANVPTYRCADEKDRKYVLDHLKELVVKEVNGAGGYGMLIGPHSTRTERNQMAKRVKENPRNFIAQPTLKLSTMPTLINGKMEPRHIDFRPYIIFGEDIFVLPGGLTRVALKKGSLVVNSSQGGGSKDTWVLGSEAHG